MERFSVICPIYLPSTFVGDLWLYEASSLDSNLSALVKASTATAVQASQPEGTCAFLGLSPSADINNLLFGMFSEKQPSEKAFVGIWYLARLEKLDRKSLRVSARLLLGVPRLGTDIACELIVSLIDAFLGKSLETREGPQIVIEKLCYAMRDASRDDADARTRAMDECVSGMRVLREAQNGKEQVRSVTLSRTP